MRWFMTKLKPYHASFALHSNIDLQQCSLRLPRRPYVGQFDDRRGESETRQDSIEKRHGSFKVR